MGRAVLAPFLWASGIHKLDYVVLSHDHPDHRNGLRFVLAHFNVGCFWESGATEGSQPGSELSAIAAKRQIPVKRLTEILDPHTVEGCEIRVIHPSTSFFERSWDGRNLNNLSLVLQIDFGTSSLILPGDIDQSVEAVLFRDWKSPKDLLLISPHHGSENSNPAFLFDYLQPRAIVFSCGYQNIFGFPSSKVLADCAKRNIPVFRTDLQGAIEATSDGHEWHIRPANRRGN
jgi:competence protein ComEC